MNLSIHSKGSLHSYQITPNKLDSARSQISAQSDLLQQSDMTEYNKKMKNQKLIAKLKKKGHK